MDMKLLKQLQTLGSIQTNDMTKIDIVQSVLQQFEQLNDEILGEEELQERNRELTVSKNDYALDSEALRVVLFDILRIISNNGENCIYEAVHGVVYNCGEQQCPAHTEKLVDDMLSAATEKIVKEQEEGDEEDDERL